LGVVKTLGWKSDERWIIEHGRGRLLFVNS